MVTLTYVYMSGACGKVSISSRNGPCSNPASGKIHYGTPSLLFLGAVFVKQCFGGGASAGLVSRVEWMVCNSDCASSSSEATTCNHKFSESE